MRFSQWKQQDFTARLARDPKELERLLAMLARGDFDLVAVGRALIVNAGWPNKVRAGQFDRLAADHPTALETLV